MASAGYQSRTDFIIKATGEGFEKLSASLAQIGEAMDKSLKKVASTSSSTKNSLDKLRESINQLSLATEKLATSTQRSNQTTEQGSGMFRNMQWTVKSFIGDMEKLIQIQMRWYGTRLVLDTIEGGFRDAGVAIVKYNNDLEMATATMARHLALGGATVPEARAQAGGVTTAMRRALTEQPVTLKDLATTTESMIGAGVSADTVANYKVVGAVQKTGLGTWSEGPSAQLTSSPSNSLNVTIGYSNGVDATIVRVFLTPTTTGIPSFPVI